MSSDMPYTEEQIARKEHLRLSQKKVEVNLSPPPSQYSQPQQFQGPRYINYIRDDTEPEPEPLRDKIGRASVKYFEFNRKDSNRLEVERKKYNQIEKDLMGW